MPVGSNQALVNTAMLAFGLHVHGLGFPAGGLSAVLRGAALLTV